MVGQANYIKKEASHLDSLYSSNACVYIRHSITLCASKGLIKIYVGIALMYIYLYILHNFGSWFARNGYF